MYLNCNYRDIYVAVRFDHLDDDEERDGGQDVKKSGKPFEHIARVDERVEWEGCCNDDHDDDDNDERDFGAKKVAALGPVLPEEVVVKLANGFVVSGEKVTASPESWMAPQEDPAVGVVQSEPVIFGLGFIITEGQVNFFFAEMFMEPFISSIPNQQKMYLKFEFRKKNYWVWKLSVLKSETTWILFYGIN